jgi:hypothetical protein
MSDNNNGSMTLTLVMLAILGVIAVVVQTVIDAIGGSDWYWASGAAVAYFTWRFRRIWWR